MTFEVGTRCWYPSENGWIPCEVSKNEPRDGKYHLQFTLEDGSLIDLDTDSIDYNDSLSNEGSPMPVLRNPHSRESTQDLTTLSYLNEPAVLHAIKLRYMNKEIYTYSGIVLVATNPFAQMEELYSNDMIKKYSRITSREDLDPHLFAIAHDAYTTMDSQSRNQTIVVSGESGAGKTVSAKYIMRYFASLDDNNAAIVSEMSDIEKKILATNPIMEAFGNAKTIRNDNSSRFGKYLQIMFDAKKNIIGAQIRTYLLERSRLVFQQQSERNYHIFYQLLAGLPAAIKEELCISNPEQFYYLNQGSDPKIDGVDDALEFQDTIAALSVIGINDSLQMEVFKILAGLLHIGNIEIKQSSTSSSISPDEPNLKLACELLGLDPYEFSKWLTKKEITTRSEKIVTNLKKEQALVVRDSVSKFIYSLLFDWLVNQINTMLHGAEVSDQVRSFIGVLDIYGFEHFEMNSFEQFCINYANEKLQQEFNQHVFKLEQEEYVREKIEWSFIEFNDNQPCIDLIENRLGILSLLDEESRLPSGTDESWTQKLYQTLDKPPMNQVFSKPKFGQTKFVISHYADNVEYDVEGFIEKNRDTVSESLMNVLKNSQNDTLISLTKPTEETSTPPPQTASISRPKLINKKPTLGFMFKKSLGELMEIINNTNVHYIRCVKPNSSKVAWEFDDGMVLSQLRACGILETIKISCAGFPSRWSFQEFIDRYYMLVDTTLWSDVTSSESNAESSIKFCKEILGATELSHEKCQIGQTKIFFKSGVLAELESLRLKKMKGIAITIQKKIRAYKIRTWYLEIVNCVRDLQNRIHSKLVRLDVEHQLKTKLALMMQATLRSYRVRIRVAKELDDIILLQCKFRTVLAQRYLQELKRNKASIMIQSYIRGYKHKTQYRYFRKNYQAIQALSRSMLARSLMLKLRSESEVTQINGVTYTELHSIVKDIHDSMTSNNQIIKELDEFNGVIDTQKSLTFTDLSAKAEQLNSDAQKIIIKHSNQEKQIKDLKESKGDVDSTLTNIKKVHNNIKSLDKIMLEDAHFQTGRTIISGLGIEHSSQYENINDNDNNCRPNDYNLLQIFRNNHLIVKEIMKEEFATLEGSFGTISFILGEMIKLKQFLSAKQFISTLFESIHSNVIEESSYDKKLKSGFQWFSVAFSNLSVLRNSEFSLGKETSKSLSKLLADYENDLSKMLRSWILSILNDMFRENDKLFNDFASVEISNVISFKILQQKIKYIQSKMGTSAIEKSLFGKLIETLIQYLNLNVANHVLIKIPSVDFETGIILEKNLDTLLEYCEELKLSNCRNSTRQTSQMSKLLQLSISSVEELRVVCQYCFALNLTQIHALLAKQKASSDEKPMPYIVVKKVQSWAQETKKDTSKNSDIIFRLDSDIVKCEIDTSKEIAIPELHIPEDMTLVKEIETLSQ